MSGQSHISTIRELRAETVRFAYPHLGGGGGGGQQQPAVEDASFRLVPGELVAIVGPNGCGKSTLLKLLLGVMRPVAGRVVLDDGDLQRVDRLSLARQMAIVPAMAGDGGGEEGYSVLGGGADGGFTVREIVLMARFAAHRQQAGPLARLVQLGFENAADLEQANVAMWETDVHHLAGRALGTLSGGERQRVAIARALAQQTPVLLLDEPTSALDLYHQLELLAKLQALAGGGHLVVMVTHDLPLAARCASRVVLMDQGRIVADGPPLKVLTAEVLEPVYRVRVRGALEGLRFERMAEGGSGGGPGS